MLPTIYRATVIKASLDEGSGPGMVESLTEAQPRPSSKPSQSKFQLRTSVTQLSKQLWCEAALYYELATGRQRVTESMLRGSRRHEVLESEMVTIIPVQVVTWEEFWATHMLNTISQLNQFASQGICREVWVCGSICEAFLVGIIDLLKLVDENGQKVQIQDNKTRTTKSLPSVAQQKTSYFQLQLYHYLLGNLVHQSMSADDVVVGLNTQHNALSGICDTLQISQLDPHKGFQSEHLMGWKNLLDITDAYLLAFKTIPPLSNFCKVLYEHEGVDFDEHIFKSEEKESLSVMRDLMEFWRGDRTPEVVLPSEKWKCRSCVHLRNCEKTPLDVEEVYSIISGEDGVELEF